MIAPPRFGELYKLTVAYQKQHPDSAYRKLGALPDNLDIFSGRFIDTPHNFSIVKAPKDWLDHQKDQFEYVIATGEDHEKVKFLHQMRPLELRPASERAKEGLPTEEQTNIFLKTELRDWVGNRIYDIQKSLLKPSFDGTAHLYFTRVTPEDPDKGHIAKALKTPYFYKFDKVKLAKRFTLDA